MNFKWPELPPISRRVAPNVWDFAAFALIIAAFVAVAEASVSYTHLTLPTIYSV